jgi:Tfp pilus assembly protein FimT
MMIVVTMVAIVSSIAIPRFNYTAMRLDANAQAVRAVLQQAWRLSIQKQHDVDVSFDVAGKRIRTLEDQDNNRTAGTGERVTWRPLEEGTVLAAPTARLGGATPLAAVAGTGVMTVDGMPTIVFHRNGSASGDAEIYLAFSSRGKTDRRAIMVAQATGRTDWYKYVGGAWRNAGL